MASSSQFAVYQSGMRNDMLANRTVRAMSTVSMSERRHNGRNPAGDVSVLAQPIPSLPSPMTKPDIPQSHGTVYFQQRSGAALRPYGANPVPVFYARWHGRESHGTSDIAICRSLDRTPDRAWTPATRDAQHQESSLFLRSVGRCNRRGSSRRSGRPISVPRVTACH